MPIKTSCNCGFSFSAKDQLAGRLVKCPRCTNPVKIPDTTAQLATGGATAAPQVNKRLLDLLDEAGVKSTPKGPICSACGEEMDPTAVICVNCGYNVATGQYLDTYTDEEEIERSEAVGMTDAEKVMAKAEAEIEDTPIVGDDQDFGDGADSYVIAMVAAAVMSILVLIGLGVVLMMESLTESVNTGLISGIASSSLAVMCALWITLIAFRSNKAHAIGCIASLGLYCPIYGFIQGRGTIGAAVVMLIALVIGGASWAYVYYTGAI